jgi:methylmalonyl-CoA mutase
MSAFLFDEFNKTSIAAWKQKIQVDLNGADYNDTLLWKTCEGIVVKPFYTSEDRVNHKIETPKKEFNICQTIFVDNEKTANSIAIKALERGANSIQFRARSTFNYTVLLKGIDFTNTLFYFDFSFLNDEFQIELSKYINTKNTYFQTDIIGYLAETGNWFTNLKTDFKKLKNIANKTKNCLSISLDVYQNSGANITQQLAYTLAHANEYLNEFGANIAPQIHFNISIGSNYFFEIAKLRALRILWLALLKQYNLEESKTHIFAKPTLRNKTLYDYNVNMLRTTSECMSGILGGANTISNVSYDTIYHKSNEFGERIARNQLLILQQESGLNNPQNYAEGTYYIESLTNQLAEKALITFKEIEKSGGFLKQLKAGIIHKKIKESAQKEEESFNKKEIVLLGTNLQENKKESMQEHIEIYPFVKQRNIKTLIPPLTRKRLSESTEKNRLDIEGK